MMQLFLISLTFAMDDIVSRAKEMRDQATAWHKATGEVRNNCFEGLEHMLNHYIDSLSDLNDFKDQLLQYDQLYDLVHFGPAHVCLPWADRDLDEDETANRIEELPQENLEEEEEEDEQIEEVPRASGPTQLEAVDQLTFCDNDREKCQQLIEVTDEVTELIDELSTFLDAHFVLIPFWTQAWHEFSYDDRKEIAFCEKELSLKRDYVNIFKNLAHRAGNRNLKADDYIKLGQIAVKHLRTAKVFSQQLSKQFLKKLPHGADFQTKLENRWLWDNICNNMDVFKNETVPKWCTNFINYIIQINRTFVPSFGPRVLEDRRACVCCKERDVPEELLPPALRKYEQKH